MQIGYLKTTESAFEYTIVHIPKNTTTIDGYTPKNKKCFCYPYNYLEVFNNYGEKVDIKYELFNDAQTAPTNDMQFYCYGLLGENPLLVYYPREYKGKVENYDYVVQYGNFPVLPWNNDLYANWSARNSASITSNFIIKSLNTTLGVAGNLASYNVGGAMNSLVNGAESIASNVAGLIDKAKTPNRIEGNIQGNFTIFSGGAGVYYSYTTAKAEYIEIIDNYFTRYGYLVNTTKAITITNRKSFDYVQTKDCNIQGNIPQEDIDELEAIFNNGLTIWHNETTYGDYNVDNRPRTT